MAITIVSLQQKIEKILVETQNYHKKLSSAYDLEVRCHDYYDDGDPMKKGEQEKIQELIHRVNGEILLYKELIADCSAIIAAQHVK